MSAEMREHELTCVKSSLMDPSTELRRALDLLGLTVLPGNPDELTRLVVSKCPATEPWTSQETWAYRHVYSNLGS